MQAKKNLPAHWLHPLHNGCQRIFTQSFSDNLIDLLLQIAQNRLDTPADRTILTRTLRVKGKNLPTSYGLVNFAEADLRRALREASSTVRPGLRRDEPSMAQLAQNSPDHHRIGVDAAGHLIGLDWLIVSPRQ